MIELTSIQVLLEKKAPEKRHCCSNAANLKWFEAADELITTVCCLQTMDEGHEYRLQNVCFCFLFLKAYNLQWAGAALGKCIAAMGKASHATCHGHSTGRRPTG